MGFEQLLGNQRLKDNLLAGIRRGRASHFYLISGPAGSGKKTLARLLSAALLCQSPEKPCLGCTACRKVMADTHPDLITVTDPEHKNVAVKIVRQVRDEMFIRPNEADKKIYVFPQELGIEGQNALLKVLEEPPTYGVFMLLSDNPEKLLPTVRSRCNELHLQALPADILRRQLLQDFPEADSRDIDAAVARSGGYLGQAKTLLEEGTAIIPQTETFVQSLVKRDPLALMQALVPMERWKRDQFLPVLEQWTGILQQALSYRSGMQVTSDLSRQIGDTRSSEDILTYIRCLQKSIEYAQGNVSVAAVCGYLEWALR